MAITLSERFKPDLIRYWNQQKNDYLWFAVYGDVIGIGLTPAKSMANFDTVFEGGPMEGIDLSTLDSVRSMARMRRKGPS